MAPVHVARASRKHPAAFNPVTDFNKVRPWSALTWALRCLFLADQALGWGSPSGAARPLSLALSYLRCVPASVRAPHLDHLGNLLVWKAELELSLRARES